VERVKLLDGSVVGLRRVDARDFDAVLLLHKNLTAEWLTPYIRDIAVLAFAFIGSSGASRSWAARPLCPPFPRT
jgi:hypothetical protein